jgi:peptidyl-prolyl cis-trans isomerase D
VVKLLDKQEPSADENAKNFDQTRDQILEERRTEAFQVFMSNVFDNYKKHKRIQLNAKAQGAQDQGM